MSELLELFKNNTHSSDKWNGYFDVYTRHLSKYKNKAITLVEVGVQKGGSLSMWSRYLGPSSTIIGIDIDPECLKLQYEEKNISVVIGDQSSETFWDSFLEKTPNIDIFIDDGGHLMKEQIITFEKIYPKVSTNGIYICEDTHTSYWPDSGGGLNNLESFVEYAKDYIDVINYEWKLDANSPRLNKKYELVKNTISGIFFYNSMVVFEKELKPKMHRIFPTGY